MTKPIAMAQPDASAMFRREANLFAFRTPDEPPLPDTELDDVVPSPVTGEALDRFTEFHQNYLSVHIQLADAKAGVVLGVSASVLGYLLSQDYFREAVIRLSGWQALVSWAAIITLMTAFGMAFAVILPRHLRTGPGPIFFHAVAQFGDQDSYMEALAHNSAESLAEARARNCYFVSRVCSRKYTILRLSMCVCAAAIAASGISMLLLQL